MIGISVLSTVSSCKQLLSFFSLSLQKDLKFKDFDFLSDFIA